MNRFLPWRVLHLSVVSRLPDLNAEIGVGGLFVVFWLDRIPLGQMVVPTALLPMSSAQLEAAVPSTIARAVGYHLLRTGFESPGPMPPRKQLQRPPADLGRLLALHHPLASLSRLADRQECDASTAPVSLVICTSNRPERLAQCLASVRGLSPQPSEIIVVDNDPSSDVTRRLTEQFRGIRYVAEPRRGLSAARNTGIRHCTTGIVAFTDDDVIVHAAWIGAIRAAFRDPAVMAITGLVLPAELATAAQFVFQSDAPDSGWGYSAVDFDPAFFARMKHLAAPVWRMGAGANMAFRRDAFDRVGLFDERLGAGRSGCSEDSELWYRLVAEGHRCRYTPRAVVFHYHRSDWEALRSQMYSYMRGHVAALLFQYDRYRHWGNLYRAFIALPWYLARITVGSATRQLAQRLAPSAADSLSPPLVPQILGALAGYGYYLRHRHLSANSAPPEDVRASSLLDAEP
jgi:GT2 family glycosyltransferase